MELTLDGHPMFQVDGPVTIELPEYMNVLGPEELLEAQSVSHPTTWCPVLIVAAGRHPETGDIVFMTTTGELREINCDRFVIPEGKVRPVDYGLTIRVETGRIERGGNVEGFEMSHEWALDNSELIIDLGPSPK